MDNKPEEETVEGEYQIMEEKPATASGAEEPTPEPATAPSVPTEEPASTPSPMQTPTPSTPTLEPTAAKEIELPTYSPNTEPATVTTPPVESKVDTSLDVLVAIFTGTRLIAAIALVVSAGSMASENPGLNYLIAGFFLFASFIAEFLAKASTPTSFGTGITASLIIIIGGTLAFDRRDVNIDIIGVMWFFAAALLVVSHSFDIISNYGKVNLILILSDIFALIGSSFFAIGGIIMFSLDDVGADDVYKFGNMFTYGGVAYLIHAINMGTGHKVVLDRVFDKAQTRYQQKSAPLQPELV